MSHCLSSVECALEIDSLLERSFLLQVFLLFSVYESLYMGTLSGIVVETHLCSSLFLPMFSYGGCWCVC
jgi:hypothetical protein